MIHLARVLCPIDFSLFSDRALAYATTIAERSHAKLQVLHVTPLSSSTPSELAESTRIVTARHLREMVERYQRPGLEIESKIVESESAAERIVESAALFEADLVVVGSHGRSGIQRALLGSVTEALLHQCPRPLLVIPSHVDPGSRAERFFSRIVCAVDFAAASLDAAAFAVSMAEDCGATLLLLHVIDTPPGLSHAPLPLDHFVAPLRAGARASALKQLEALIPQKAKGHAAIEAAVVEGGVTTEVLRAAVERHADLIVLGVHGRNTAAIAFFGSNSRDIIRNATCPVMVVPS